MLQELASGKSSKTGELELEVAVVRIEHGAEACRWSIAASTSAVERETLAILAQFHLQSLDLTPKKAVLMVCSIGCLLEFLDLGLKVFEMLFLPLSESSLSSPVLGFALLHCC